MKIDLLDKKTKADMTRALKEISEIIRIRSDFNLPIKSMVNLISNHISNIKRDYFPEED